MSDTWNFSFIASLYSVTPGHKGRIGISLVEGGIDNDGWLQVMTDTRLIKPVNFRFDYVSHTDRRITYNISSSSDTGFYRGAAVGKNFNHYVGLFPGGTSEPWLVKPMGEWGDHDVLRLKLYDTYECSIGNYRHSDGMDYLNVISGQNLEFEAHVLRVLS